MTEAAEAGALIQPSLGSRARDRVAPGFVAMAAGAVLIVGAAFVPWLSLYAGLAPIAGTEGENGQLLVGLGVLAIVVAAGVLRASTNAVSRWVLLVMGVVGAALGGAALAGLLATVRELQADPLLVASIQPGLFLAEAGALGLLATGILPGTSFDPGAGLTGAARSDPAMRGILAGALAVGGAFHLALVPSHLSEGWLGAGFLLGGIAQLGLAIRFYGRPSRWIYGLVAALSLFLALAYVAAVTVGLPGLEGVALPIPGGAPGAHTHAEALGPLGPTENATVAGLLTATIEGLTAIAAIVVMRRLRDPSPEIAPVEPATAALPLR